MKLISGTSNPELSQAISDYVGVPLTEANIKRFADKEIFIKILDDIRGEDVFFIQSTSYPANVNVMELLIAIDAIRRASARRVTAVIPYFGYARQDRKTESRTPITAKLIANLITTAGADRILTMELHAAQIQGFFDIPLDDLQVGPIFKPHIDEQFKGKKLCVVSPDVGGVVRARAFAKRIDANLAIIDKRREKAGVSEVMHVIGNVEGETCILLDDIVDSGGTLCNAASALRAHGAKDVYAYCVHGVLSGEAVNRINESEMAGLVISDTIRATDDIKNSPKITQVSVANLIGEAILRTHQESSISELFK
ncbi:MAG: ribose-phosphate pyrophosphokinase [Rhodospirillales bacterium]|nr:ribose-phosphate pyrophosphokinase [Rhodospirillales bacterium]MCB9973567.1 ribose-phosphate pyrophosphokinase [Rhodospirillales bacterium]MCB9979629.1 ribose-phosphate pyrophosphokinase [Rhodospirillales bacterium]